MNIKSELYKIIVYIFITIALVLTPNFSKGAVHNISFKIEKSAIYIDSLVKEGIEYNTIGIEGYEDNLTPNEPILPVKILKYSVPTSSFQYTLNCIPRDSIELNLNHKIAKNDADVFLSDKLSDYIDYSMSENNNTAQISHSDLIGGFCKYISIKYSPIKYLATSNSIIIYTDLELMLSWEENKCKDYIIPNTEEKFYSIIENAKQHVINPNDVISNAPKLPKAVTNQFSNEKYDYLIITNNDLAEAFDPLITIRQMQGLKCKIVDINEILSDERFSEGDTISKINDDAGKLRSYLRYMYQNKGIEYVLLGGDKDIIPIRYSSNYDSKGMEHKCISDLYFSELVGDWDANRNGKYGEFDDFSDLSSYESQLYVTRIPVKNKIEIKNFIEKLLIYEFNPGDGNPGYLNNALGYVCDEFHSTYDKYMIEIYSDAFINLDSYYQETSEKPTGSDLINIFNTKNVGFFDLHCHGGPNTIFTNYFSDYYDLPKDNRPKLYAITSLDSDTPGAEMDENNNGLNNLNNKNFPNWTISLSCSTMNFDFGNNNTSNNLSYCFAASYIMGKNYGGIGFIGYTNDGHYVAGRHHIKNFLNVFNDYHNKDDARDFCLISKIESDSRIYFLNNAMSSSQNKHWAITTRAVFGDPYTFLWKKSPSTEINYNLYNETVKVSSYSFIADNVSNEYDSLEVALEKSNNPNQSVLIQGTNIIPFLKQITIDGDVSQNPYFDNLFSLVCNDNVKCIDDRAIIFENGCNVELNINGDTKIDNKIKFEDGCNVKIKCNGSIEITSLTIPSDANIQIWAKNLKLNQGININNFKFYNIR